MYLQLLYYNGMANVERVELRKDRRNRPNPTFQCFIQLIFKTNKKKYVSFNVGMWKSQLWFCQNRSVKSGQRVYSRVFPLDDFSRQGLIMNVQRHQSSLCSTVWCGNWGQTLTNWWWRRGVVPNWSDWNTCSAAVPSLRTESCHPGL